MISMQVILILGTVGTDANTNCPCILWVVTCSPFASDPCPWYNNFGSSCYPPPPASLLAGGHYPGWLVTNITWCLGGMLTWFLGLVLIIKALLQWYFQGDIFKHCGNWRKNMGDWFVTLHCGSFSPTVISIFVTFHVIFQINNYLLAQPPSHITIEWLCYRGKKLLGIMGQCA